jgi:hypothetical protein
MVKMIKIIQKDKNVRVVDKWYDKNTNCHSTKLP